MINLSFQKVIDTFTSQNFPKNNKNREQGFNLHDLVLFPNQFAYSIDCQKGELKDVIGNTQILKLSKSDFRSIDIFPELVHPKDIQIFMHSIMQNFKYILGKDSFCIPMRNSFSVSYRTQKIKNNRSWVKRDTFISKSCKGVVYETIGVISLSDNYIGISKNPRMYGPDSTFFGKEFLAPFENILSIREIELMALIAKGYSTKACSENMFISTRTVETHRKNMIKKLEANNTPHLVAICKDLGLI